MRRSRKMIRRKEFYTLCAIACFGVNAAEDYCAKAGSRFMDLPIVNHAEGIARLLPSPGIRRNWHCSLHSRLEPEAALSFRENVEAVDLNPTYNSRQHRVCLNLHQN